MDAQNNSSGTNSPVPAEVTVNVVSSPHNNVKSNTPQEFDMVDNERKSLSNGMIKDDDNEEDKMKDSDVTTVRCAANLSLGVNILLFITKLIVFILSLSISVVASLIDSLLDLVSQVIMFWTERNVTKVSKSYPVGKTRLEPISVLTVSILMVMLSVTVIRESVDVLVRNDSHVDFSTTTICIMGFVILLKFLLWLYCRRFTYSAIAITLAEDHINDVWSNSVALIAGALASNIKSIAWLDAVGGIVISLYIICRWWVLGSTQMRKLVGHAAEEESIKQLRLLCDRHDERISVDVLRAYHIGRNLLVEVEIIMPKETTLEVSHDVSLNLQKKIEALDYVERAFVHVDYMARDYDEHKKPTLA